MPPVRLNDLSGVTFFFPKHTAPSPSFPNPDDTKAPLPPSSGKKRPHTHFLEDSDDESPHGIHDEIVAFSQAAGGAIGAHGSSPADGRKIARTIAVAPNKRRWAAARSRQATATPMPATDGNSDGVNKDAKFGLSIMTKRAGADDTMVDQAKAAETEPQKTEDDVAMAALLGRKDTRSMIPVLTEEEALQRDMEDVGEQPTAESYLALPAEDFGAALLRGMGWKDTETFRGGSAGFKTPKNEGRAPLLGLGAEAADDLGVEIGAWGKKTRANEAYIPLVLENIVTGERPTEEELKNKAEQESRGKGSNEKDLVLKARGGDRSRGKRDEEQRDYQRRDRTNERTDYDRGGRNSDRTKERTDLYRADRNRRSYKQRNDKYRRGDDHRTYNGKDRQDSDREKQRCRDDRPRDC